MLARVILAASVVLLVSCSNKYHPFEQKYKFTSEKGSPDYSNLEYWAAHPSKWDPADSIPAALRDQQRDSSVDVFFIHPTTYTENIGEDNARIDDSYVNAKTDYSSILYQASVFNGDCRVFAPRYRQASIKMFFEANARKREQAFELAFEDVVAAFQYYLRYWNKGRPIIIAGHSQGALMAEQLLKDYVEGKPLEKQLIVAYVVGWAVPKDYFSSLKICSDSLQTGCVCSWRTLRKDYVPPYLTNEHGNSFVTNPLTWTSTEVYAPRELNSGSILFDFNKLYPHTTDAQISNGLLYVHKPKFPWGFFYHSKNYHVGDINLFYMNVRHNIHQRIESFEKGRDLPAPNVQPANVVPPGSGPRGHISLQY